MLMLRINATAAMTHLFDRGLCCFFHRLRGLISHVARIMKNTTLFADALHEVKLCSTPTNTGLIAGKDA